MQRSTTPYNDIIFQTELAPALPYDDGTPQINGPALTGASPEKEFLYLIPTVGARPMHFTATGLPDGIVLDAEKGILRGKATVEGCYHVSLKAENALGTAEKTLDIVIQKDALALTPPLGWNSWNCFRSDISGELIEEIADAMVSSGLAARGYSYVNIDSGWQSKKRGGKYNSIIPSEAFPDMAGLCGHIHSLGLKAGIYSSPYVFPWGTEGRGTTDGLPDTSFPISYGRYIGMNKHEAEDVRQWAEWGFDYLKYDWCATDPYHTRRMANQLRESSRDFVFSLATGVGIDDIREIKQLANLYRSNSDTAPYWNSIVQNGFKNEQWNGHTGPGHWFDLDMLSTQPRDGKALTRNELISQVTCWMMRPSPIMLDCDPRTLDGDLKSILCNEEMIAVNQDPLGKPSFSIFRNDSWDIQLKPLADGNCAVAFFNLSGGNLIAPYLDLSLQWGCGNYTVRDIWAKKDLGDVGNDFVVGVEAHSAKAYKIMLNL